MPAPSNGTALAPLLSRLLRDCLDRSNGSGPAQAGSPGGGPELVYVLLMVGLFGFFSAAALLSELRARRLAGPGDPYHTYIAGDAWRARDRRLLRAGILDAYGLCCGLESRPAVERPARKIPEEKAP